MRSAKTVVQRSGLPRIVPRIVLLKPKSTLLQVASIARVEFCRALHRMHSAECAGGLEYRSHQESSW